MGLPTEPVTISPAEIAKLQEKLSNLRHNVNNHLSLVLAAVELIRRKPDLAQRMADNIGTQPEKIVEELRAFSVEFEATLGITREKKAEADDFATDAG